MGYIEELREIVGHRPLIFVGSVVIIKDSQGRILMQQRRHPYGTWGLPGGLMELGESTEDTARREVLEETGLSIGELHLIDVFSGKDNFVVAENGDEFYAVVIAYWTDDVRGKLINDEKESLGCAFMQVNKLPDTVVKSHKRIIERYLAKQT
ncbi:NUDIX hydrolase [Paenibacillus hamazuiensis]|uniref:NUDIX hydrolase n=1 Tax=Paenibacillus hamazuiensis TaxID=2936508 RepID=UPI00200CC5BD|nr:NUDIX hydrolase [Paenibacillus hamazuiensis]